MPLTINCPHCHKTLTVPDDVGGKTVRCPACQNTFVIAVPQPEPPIVTVPVVTPAAKADAPAWEKESAAARRRREEQEQEEARNRKRNEDLDDEDESPIDLTDFDKTMVARLPHRGVAVMVLGIFAVVTACVPIVSWICSGIALSIANSELVQMARGRVDPAGRPIVQIGKTLAIIGLVLSFFALCVIFSGLGIGPSRRRR